MTQEYIWVANEQIEGYTLIYYLRAFPAQEGTAYGLRVDKSTPEGVLLEREETPAVLADISHAMRMAGAFAAGTVMPCTLLEMADDYLSEP
jgi:hypothetical protein